MGGHGASDLERGVTGVRRRIGRAIFERVAGPEGPSRRQVINADGGERWFAEGRPIRRVHGDSSMFIGGIRALLLQSLHPLAMAVCPAAATTRYAIARVGEEKEGRGVSKSCF